MVRRWLVVSCLVLLAIQAIVQVKLASVDSQTTDEAVHLSAGYTYLTRGDWRFNPEHPPLVKLLAALPLLAIKPHITAEMETNWEKSETLSYDSWKENRVFGESMLYGAGNNPDLLLFYGRLPMVLLTLLLGLTIFAIAFKHWGAEAALIATALYAFNPTVNGHGHLITTDIGISLGYLLSAYSFWRLLEKPTWKNTLWLGLAFGIALLSKHTAIILLPFFVVYAVGRWSWQRDWSDWQSVTLKFIGSLAISWVVIWAGFGFHDRELPETVGVSTDTTQANQTANIVTKPKVDKTYRLRPLLSLLPGDYSKGLFMVVNHVGDGHNSFLLGQTSKTGWWYYFPVLLSAKTPLAELLLVAIGLMTVIRSRPKEKLAIALLTAGGVYLLVALGSKANLGIRHILPIFPIALLAAARGLGELRRWRVLIIGLLVIW